MKHAILGLMAAVVLAAPTGFAASKMICKDTGKEVTSSCCCSVKEEFLLEVHQENSRHLLLRIEVIVEQSVLECG